MKKQYKSSIIKNCKITKDFFFFYGVHKLRLDFVPEVKKKSIVRISSD